MFSFWLFLSKSSLLRSTTDPRDYFEVTAYVWVKILIQ